MQRICREIGCAPWIQESKTRAANSVVSRLTAQRCDPWMDGLMAVSAPYADLNMNKVDGRGSELPIGEGQSGI